MILISASTLVVASRTGAVQLADDVPNFNIERGCKVDSAVCVRPECRSERNDKKMRGRRATGSRISLYSVWSHRSRPTKNCAWV